MVTFAVMRLTILGSGSAMPLPERGATAQLLQFDHAHYLIDCGEGTQVQLRRYGTWTAKLRAVFISHLHGDHYLGLVGLLWSMELSGRRKPLRIIGPEGLERLVKVHFEGMGTDLGFTVHFAATVAGECYMDETISVEAIPLDHRIVCHGFVFSERPRLRNIIKEKVLPLGLVPYQYLDLRNGLDVTLPDGQILKNEDLTHEPPTPRRYVYATDTRPVPLPDSCHGCHLLYHEATFLDEMKDRAESTHHSTAADAARCALSIGAKKLLIGHFSSRYTDLEPHLDEARAIFPATELAIDLTSFDIERTDGDQVI